MAIIRKSITLDFAAVGNGSTNDASSFSDFNTWALANQGTDQIYLDLPYGKVFQFDTVPAWAKGIKNLIVNGNRGATIQTTATSFFLAGLGTTAVGPGYEARVATVSAYASQVQCLTPADASIFTVGTYARLSGFDLQGLFNSPYGFPQNHHFFETVKITGVSAITGIVTFERPIKNAYKSTWPNYNTDNAGPATLSLLDPSYDTQVEFIGLTISNGNSLPVNVRGRVVKFRNCTFPGALGVNPSEMDTLITSGCDLSNCTIEADKLVGMWWSDSDEFHQIDFQSSSIDLFVMKNGSTDHGLTGTPKVAILDGCNIDNFQPGAFNYGRSDEVIARNCVFGAVGKKGVISGDLLGYSMSGGVITIPNTAGAVPWAVPGTNLMWQGPAESETAFQVTDVTQDGTNTYIHTSLAGGFPGVALQSGELKVRAHPAPKLTFTNCSGCADALDLSRATAGAPMYSYSRRTYTKASTAALQAKFSIWGALSRFSFNVTSAYAGAGALTMNALSQFNNFYTVKSDYSAFTYPPVINIKVPGERVVTPGGADPALSGDSGLTSTQAVWFTGQPAAGAAFSADVSGAASDFSVTIELQTDQGVVTPTRRHFIADFV